MSYVHNKPTLQSDLLVAVLLGFSYCKIFVEKQVNSTTKKDKLNIFLTIRGESYSTLRKIMLKLSEKTKKSEI